ncbi:exported hypothetical protein [Acidobacteriia bacterium SbA2]|nr:exported hypothetical protein [Acidobacteriia bacterium SbA2]
MFISRGSPLQGSAGAEFAKFAVVAALCLGTWSSLSAASGNSERKTKKPQPPPLPSRPLGPVPQIPLDSIAPVPPQVSYQNGQLTIVAPNSTLGDILQAVRKQIGAEIEIPDATDRVVTHLGPGTPGEVIAKLLNGSRFNYVLLSSSEDSSRLMRVVLVARTSPSNVGRNTLVQQPGTTQPRNMAPQPQPAQYATDESNDPEFASPNPPGQPPGTMPENEAPPAPTVTDQSSDPE